ncbi:hypothetical protein SAICODRAFT_31622 [Saitoella complicata NRRL Y-17804]|uniref:uncharacterized protein n=1 Tax=Saitoella complicata (strain BCRC 22490 / CBS 7301 / JCM 7358 / NBRC 10748 / NRRL Y-17804) TaxID=698492 RepID=UPI0008669750|nr:uncharacterized protein SAICODRAFT_31622 [Saitoella complicata NRRL Y-17804]ODQ50849.1 hypothetical protein SAICODRAFT_31622 [Saitoella complicata NRRL Y-17804]
MARTTFVAVLVAGMLVSGVLNTILTKYQDMQYVDDERKEKFEQPVWQTLNMFAGEMGCWLVVLGYRIHHAYFQQNDDTAKDNVAYSPVSSDETAPLVAPASDEEHADSGVRLKVDGRQELRGWKLLYMALPAACDICGTTLMNVGLLFVSASIYQMIRGALVLYVGLFSVIFLRRRLQTYQWIGLISVMLGVLIVGLSGALQKDTSVGSPPESGPAVDVTRSIFGITLIAAGQLFTASQFVFEEWILESHQIEPLKMVCWEGISGFVMTSVGMAILYPILGKAHQGGYFDLAEGWRQLTYSPVIWGTSIAIMFSIGSFNFFGLSVTQTVSATSRSTIDTMRTFFIWMVSLSIGWESFSWLQVIGFVVLVYGTFLFNGLVGLPFQHSPPKAEDPLPEHPSEHL